MHIDLSVKEYFEQLQLMEAQYGQEEALYPWIYMLLQMAEGKKRNLLSDYQGISIRDVHNAVSGYKDIKEPCAKAIKQFMQGKAFPDFIMLDRNADNKECCCFGCVEIKALGDSELDVGNDEIFTVKPPNTYNYEMKFMINDGMKDIFYCIEIDEEMYASLEKKYSFAVSIEDNNFKVMADDIEPITFTEVKTKAWKGRHSSIPRVRKIPQWCSVKPFNGETVLEMMSHIECYPKVLYTNGLQFCFITLLEKQNEQIKFKVTEIANLKEDYEDYKKYKNRVSNQFNENAAILEWDKLITGLMSIDWCAEPINCISIK